MSDESKLPKWAQNELKKLRQDLAGLESQIAQLTNKEPSPITYQVMMEQPTNLPSHSSVMFQFGSNHKRIRCSLNQAGWLDINGDETLIIQARATNSVWIKPL